jgi:hypothetical protein
MYGKITPPKAWPRPTPKEKWVDETYHWYSGRMNLWTYEIPPVIIDSGYLCPHCLHWMSYSDAHLCPDYCRSLDWTGDRFFN